MDNGCISLLCGLIIFILVYLTIGNILLTIEDIKRHEVTITKTIFSIIEIIVYAVIIWYMWGVIRVA